MSIKPFYAFILLLAFVLLGACAQKEKQEASSDDHEHSEWSYAGETSPEHWAEIEKNSDCSGKRQSPINIIDINVIEKQDDSSRNTLFYSPKTILRKVRNNGHTVQFDFDKGDSICSSDAHYDLIQIHFHEPSEHTINGVRYPIEIHLVHQSKRGDYEVLAIFGVEGKLSETFESMESYLPLAEGEEKEINRALDLTSILPENRDYYSYKGSLTTPPCTENVNWVIFKNPIVVSLEEVIKLRENMPLRNYRNEQPINDRVVHLYRNPVGFSPRN